MNLRKRFYKLETSRKYITLQNFSVLGGEPNNTSLSNMFALFFAQLALGTLKFGEAEIAVISQLYTNR